MNSQPTKLDEFRIARKLSFSNRLLQSLLLLTLLIGINLFALKFAIRVDITPDRVNSLNAESMAHLQRLNGELEIVVLITEQAHLSGGRLALKDVRLLMDQYLHAVDRLGLDSFSVEYVDLFQDRERVMRLREEFRFERENVVLLRSGNHRRIIPVEELYQESALSPGSVEFRGEAAITGAILELSDPVQKRIYFTIGHGEMRLEDVDPVRGLSELANYCNARNIELRTLDLSRHDTVPPEADVIVIASPQAGFSGENVEKLRNYLERANGSIIMFLDPLRSHNLDDLLYDWGILSDDAIIMDPGSDFQTASGNLIIRRFAEHPITHSLFLNKLYVYTNRPRPVRLDPGIPRVAGVQRTVLLGTSDTSWIEMNFREESIPVFNPDRDVPGPVGVGVLSERRGGESLGLRLRGGKLLVYGDGSIISNNLFRLFGNQMLVANSLNWVLQRDHLLNIPPETIKDYRLTVSRSDLNSLLASLLVLPAVFALLGLAFRIFR